MYKTTLHALDGLILGAADPQRDCNAILDFILKIPSMFTKEADPFIISKNSTFGLYYLFFVCRLPGDYRTLRTIEHRIILSDTRSHMFTYYEHITRCLYVSC